MRNALSVWFVGRIMSGPLTSTISYEILPNLRNLGSCGRPLKAQQVMQKKRCGLMFKESRARCSSRPAARRMSSTFWSRSMQASTMCGRPLAARFRRLC